MTRTILIDPLPANAYDTEMALRAIRARRGALETELMLVRLQEARLKKHAMRLPRAFPGLDPAEEAVDQPGLPVPPASPGFDPAEESVEQFGLRVPRASSGLHPAKEALEQVGVPVPRASPAVDQAVGQVTNAVATNAASAVPAKDVRGKARKKSNRGKVVGAVLVKNVTHKERKKSNRGGKRIYPEGTCLACVYRRDNKDGGPGHTRIGTCLKKP